MKPTLWLWLSLVVGGALTAFHLLGATRVPFHPDEASLLYQSRDLETYLSDPLSLAYDPDREDQREQRYRALNPPLPKYVLGIGRILAGASADSVDADWEWDQSWEENLARGAYPNPAALNGARLASSGLLLGSLALIFLTGRSLGGDAVGFLAMLLLGINALVLLHARRAMAEGTLIFGVTLALMGIVHAHRKPFLAGLTTGIAFSAKISAVPLVPVGLLAALWPAGVDTNGNSQVYWWIRALKYSAGAGLVILVLHPFLWSNPLRAGLEMWHEREALVQAQVQTQLFPGTTLDTLGRRVAAMVGQVFILPPQFSEVGNYEQVLRPHQAAYLQTPLHSLFRGMVAGGLSMVLCGFGFASALLGLRLTPPRARRVSLVIGMASVVEVIGLLLALRLPYQRYYMPLVPIVCLWVSHGVWQLSAIRKGLPDKRAVPE